MLNFNRRSMYPLLLCLLTACTSVDTEDEMVSSAPGNEAPIIVLNGAATVTLRVGDTYTDPGVIALDEEDGNLTTQVLSNAAGLDTSKAGNYTITYQVRDSKGLAATPASRLVIIASPEEDANTAPTIALNGATIIELNLGDAYIEQGALASDAQDGDLSQSILITPSNIDTSIAGLLTITYQVKDSQGNTATVMRHLNIKEAASTTNNPPLIQLTGDNPLQLQFKQIYIEPGATATDTEDGNISDDIIYSPSMPDTTLAGPSSISYKVTDSGGLSHQLTRTIVVAQNSKPTISLLDDSPIILAYGSSFDPKINHGASGNDLEDGPVHVSIGAHSLDTSTPGEYQVIYVALDAEGQKTLAFRPIIVKEADTSLASFQLIGLNTVNLEQGDTYEEQGATATSNTGEDISQSITIKGTTNTSIAGVYTLEYALASKPEETITRKVIINNKQCPSNCSSGCIKYAQNTIECADPSQHNQLIDGVNIEASQNNCVAPCGIHFKSAIKTSFGVEHPFHHLAYHWDFGDTGSHFDKTGQDFPFSNSANHGQGPYTAHVFEKPGTYTVTLRVAAKNGNYATQTQEVIVQDPNKYFTLSETVCLSQENNFTQCPSGANEFNNWNDAADFINTLNNSRVLIHAGESYDIPNKRILYRNGRHHWNRYGEGDNPTLLVSHPSNIVDTLGIDEISVGNFNIKGDYNTSTGVGFSWKTDGFYFGTLAVPSRNVSFYNNHVSGLHICFNSRGGTGFVFANNHCTNWYNYGALSDNSSKVAFIGNSIKQDINAHSGIGTKDTPYFEEPADNQKKVFAYKVGSQSGSFAPDASHSDIAVWLIQRDGTGTDIERDQQVADSDYTLDLIAGTVTFNTTPSQPWLVLIEQKHWADHGPIREADSFELVVSLNDLFSNTGWYAGGIAHQAPLRYNTDGTAGHSGTINQNRLTGGHHIMTLEPANPSVGTNRGEGTIIERNQLIGTEATSFSIRTSYGNTTIRNNIFFQPESTPIFNGYWNGIALWENYSIDNGSDPQNFTLQVEIFNNTFINLTDDNLSANGRIDYINFTAIQNDADGNPLDEVDTPTFTHLLDLNNLIYAPKANNSDLHTKVLFEKEGLNAFPSSPSEGTPTIGLFDSFNGDYRSQGIGSDTPITSN